MTLTDTASTSTSARCELGIGAGGFWDAIEAMGGRRLTPRQSVDALDDAITVIQEIWAADRPGPVRLILVVLVTGSGRNDGLPFDNTALQVR